MKRNLFFHPEYNELILADWGRKGFGFSMRTKFSRKFGSIYKYPSYRALVSAGWKYISKFKDSYGEASE